MIRFGCQAKLCFLFLIYLGGCSDDGTGSSQEFKHVSMATDPTPFRILILGDSLTEGYGVSPDQAYPALLQEKLNASRPSNLLPYEVINGGITGSTTSGGASRIDWYMKNPPDFLVVALGGNDGLRGISPEESKKNLASILDRAKEQGVPALLAGMKMPTNYGEDYRQSFENIFPELAKEKKVPLLPFLLKDVGGRADMNLPDRIHPNPKGHQRICQTMYQHLIEQFNLPSS
jgi:acyl-CoA thioesterase-1